MISVNNLNWLDNFLQIKKNSGKSTKRVQEVDCESSIECRMLNKKCTCHNMVALFSRNTQDKEKILASSYCKSFTKFNCKVLFASISFTFFCVWKVSANDFEVQHWPKCTHTKKGVEKLTWKLFLMLYRIGVCETPCMYYNSSLEKQQHTLNSKIVGNEILVVKWM